MNRWSPLRIRLFAAERRSAPRSGPARRVATTDRDELRRWIPRGYCPARHLGAMFVLGAAGEVLLAILFAGRIRPADLLAVPATLVVATLLEYVAHRYLMHVRWRALGAIWDAHTGRHHHYYLEEAPTWERPADVWLILFSLRDVVTLIAIVVGPLAMLRAAVPAGSWALSVATSISFFLGYEALHMAYHLPDGHPALRRRWLAAMRAHHVRHHRLTNMHANYGVTTRVWDRLFGTAAA